jgi:hypothetical protein
VAVDAHGNAFVSRCGLRHGSDQGYVVIKYSGAGVPLWTNRYNGPANNEDQATDVVVDGSGNVVRDGIHLQRAMERPII